MMKDEKKTQKQLINELIELRQRISKFEKLEKKRIRLKKNLHESEAHYRETLDAMGDWILAVDQDLRITLFNEAFKQISKNLGLKTEVIGQTPMEVFTFLPPSLLDEYEWVFKNKKTLITEEITKVGDREFVTESRKIPLLKDGKIVKVVSIIRDITDKKRLETSIQHAKRIESIGTLAGGIANDFNNILTAIIGFGHLLKTEMSEYNPLTIYVTRILNAAEKAATLNRSLLAFSRTQIINPRPVDLNEIIKAMKYPLERLVGDNIKLSSFLTDNDLTIMADTYQIEQVLINLITNAMDAMKDRGSLIIRTERFDLDNKFIKTYGYGKPGPYAFLSIEDSGQGMDDETKARIFEPFFTTKEIGKETGLGLSMVYGTIKQHGGYINVYSELGKGTTFKIYLPLIDSNAKAITEEVSTEIKGGAEKILVAENDAEVREMMKDVLKVSGYTVLEAENGEKAIEVFGENREAIQLLILDVFMPKKNGKEVFDEIKKSRPDMKAIFTSGYDINVIQKKGFLEEGIDFVSKPIYPDNFLQKVREVLDR